MQDIRREMLLATDIEELLNYCSVDKLSRDICSESYFWRKFFNQYNLPFPTIHYHDPKSWIIAFEKEKRIKYNVQEFLYLVHHEIFTLDAYTNPLFFDILKVDGIDLIDLSNIQNSYILRKLKNTYHTSDCIAEMYNLDGTYSIDIIYRPHLPKTYYYTVNKDAMEKILYNIISNGINLLTANGFKVAYIK